MKRWHEDYPITHGEYVKHRKSHIEMNKTMRGRIGVPADKIDCACDEQEGRFRKLSGNDCGNPRCQVCHSEKYPKRKKTTQEIRSELKFRESGE